MADALSMHDLNDDYGDYVFTPKLRLIDGRDLVAMEIPPRAMILHPIIAERSLTMLYAPRGVGKTYVALSIAYAIATGTGCMKWAGVCPSPVLYIDGEMPLSSLQERLRQVESGKRTKAASGMLRFLIADNHDEGLPDLATAEGAAEIEGMIGDARVIILDNLSTLARQGRENESESWLTMQDFLLKQRRAGRSVVMIHHAGKGGQQRGTSAREDVLDTVIALRRPADYDAKEGARFEVHYEKARGFTGDDAESFEARLEIKDGAVSWIVRSVSDARADRVLGLLSDGLSVRDIAAETGISRPTVYRIRAALIAQGKFHAED